MAAAGSDRGVGAPAGTGPVAVRRCADACAVRPRLTFALTRQGREVPLTVPQGAEVLLEAPLPCPGVDRRREVLRTTALPFGCVLLDGLEQWGRLDLFAAADGYGAFDTDVTVTLDASAGGLSVADAGRNDIDVRGGLTERGTGTLTPTGRNRYTGGTVLVQGTLVAGGKDARHGDVRITDGAPGFAERLRVRGAYAQDAGTLEVVLRAGRRAPLAVRHWRYRVARRRCRCGSAASGHLPRAAPCRSSTRRGCAAGSPGSR
ncbi:hypothetical protein GQF42_39700 [Streptomyces broussonetiae]|uniref:Uncharacterized protein n=1 Tax=Streptomyces broussonetiae TaxID=2686304 RepID=A0A6I6NEQ0_9ACTN|nr:hypothetical protein [Streptomyces broussonetiae]QHA08580.1 hypothetical protein GQF42_39700 [Streptomyces broussonetiae]